MGVYHTNNQDNRLVAKFNTTSIYNTPIETWDGLVYKISENPLKFIADNYQVLKDITYKNQLLEVITQTTWLDSGGDLLNKLHTYMDLEEALVNEQAGHYCFDHGDIHQSLGYFMRAIELSEDKSRDNTPGIDEVYAKLGVCLISIGEVDEGLDLLSYAYQLFTSSSIELDLFKYQLEFDRLDDMTVVESRVENLLKDSENDKNLSFLVWYYDFLGETENSITSYMQIQNIEVRFKLVDYYMKYMLESNQHIAMESFLKPLRDEDESRYLLALIDVYLQLDEYEHVLSIIEDYKFSPSMKQLISLRKSYCYLKLNRIIESITVINKVNTALLTKPEEEAYYVQLARLSKFSKDLSKERIYHQSLLGFWQQQYRSVYLGILHNTKWKVKK